MRNPKTATSFTSAISSVGSIGAALALVILGASVLLRLSSVVDPMGTVTSSLPIHIENAVRLTHRITAASVGLIALALALLCLIKKSELAHIFKPITGIVVATVLLAAIGPFTSGYRYPSITVANVVGGTILLMSCWWLREVCQFRTHSYHRKSTLVIAITAFLAHIATGAAASALLVRGMNWVGYVHIGSGLLFLITVGDILWARSPNPTKARLAMFLTCLLTIQVVLGILMMWLHQQSVWLGVTHALLSQALAAGIISISLQEQSPETSAPRG